MISYNVRETQILNGLWDFKFNEGFELKKFSPAVISFDERIPVPSAFDAWPTYQGKRGLGIYRKYISIGKGKRGRLHFQGVSMWSQVWINGACVAENRCGYAPFWVNIDSGNECNEIIVIADNRFDFNRVPMHEEYFDFYQYGGIIREVILHQLPDAKPCIHAIRVRPTDDYARGEVELEIELDRPAATAIQARVQIDGVEICELSIAAGDAGCDCVRLNTPNPRLWSPNTPELHSLKVELIDPSNCVFDDTSVRYGLRRIETTGDQILLNGEPIQLIGYNRHEWHPNYGPSTPELQMSMDLCYLRDLGCNFIRGSHYHQSQRFLDLCDEMGFLVWEENLGWGQREKALTDARFKEDHHLALKSMVQTSFNHPCVIIWGFLNEAKSNEDYARPIFEETVRTLRELDDSRLISFASMFAEDDLMFDLVDLISLNLYPGWYDAEGVDDPLELIGPRFDRVLDSLEQRGFKNKPVMISEIGVEGLYGWHDPHNDFFTEQFQADYLEKAINETLSRRFCGIALWHFSDARTYSGGWSIKRPRTHNNKGTMDEYRRPKLAYKAVKQAFHVLQEK